VSKSKKIKKPAAKKTSKKIKSNAAVFYPLQKGDLIEIIAPGSAAPKENLEQGAETLRSWGYQVRFAADLLNPNMYLAHNDAYRFESFKRAITNKESKAVWCLRGGYGAIRILPQVEKMAVPKSKKLFIGYSDICSLHTVMNQKWKWPTLHASLVDRLAGNQMNADNLKELKESISQESFIAEFNQLKPMNVAALKNKRISSKIVGGNLVVVNSTLGTPSQIKTKNRIVFLEEIGERGYKVDRCLYQLKQAGIFDSADAVILGDFLNGLEPGGKDLVSDTLKNFFKDLKIPAFSGVEAGHGDIQRPLFFNTHTILTCGPKPQMLVYPDYEIHKPRK
jgi:muramoyltetrapeptide carboxypeptidase